MSSLSDRFRSFVSELQRRRVFRVAVAYAVAAWLLVEVADTVFPRLLLPDWTVTLVVVLALAGFPVAVALAWWFDVVPDPATGRRARALRLGFVVVIGILAMAAASQTWQRLADRTAIDSLVVLPFETWSGSPADDFYVAGMHSAIIGELGRLGRLRVISRRSSLRYENTTKTIPEIARELDVRAVVEASVARAGDAVEIRVELIQAEPAERQLFTEAFTSAPGNVLTMHSNIARAIAERIELALSPEQELRLAEARPVDPSTYEAYLRGMHHLNLSTPEDVQRGLDYLHEAVNRDPADARAYAGLATGYANLGHGFAPPPDAWDRARAAAERAIALDPTLAEGHAALADVKLYHDWDWDGAERAFRRADELNPNLAMNHYHYAWFLALFGQLDEAIVAHIRAQSLDPLDPLHTAWLGGLYLMDGRPEAAEAEARKALEIVPDNPHGLFVLGDALLVQGRHEEAIATHERLASVAPPVAWTLARTLAVAGRAEEARVVVAELERSPNSMTAFGLASVWAELGDLDRAFEWLAYEPPHAWLPWVYNLHWFERLRDDPRFDDLLDRMNLPRVNRRAGDPVSATG